MSFNGNVSVTQPNNKTGIQVQDTSTGTDPNLTNRRIYLYRVDNVTTIVPPGTTTPYINWPLSDGSIKTINNIFDKDYSLSIVVVWDSSSPLAPPSTYTITQVCVFEAYTLTFLYGLLTTIAANRQLQNDRNFKDAMSDLFDEVDNASLAVSQGNDQGNAQAALNRAFDTMDKQDILF